MEEVADIKGLFEIMDVNKNGRITLDELKIGLHKTGHQVPDADLQILMEAVSIWIANPFFFTLHLRFLKYLLLDHNFFLLVCD